MADHALSDLSGKPRHGFGRRCRCLLCRTARRLRRAWRRLLRYWSSNDVSLVFHPDYSRPFPGSPVDPQRAERILAFLAEERLISQENISTPRSPSMKNLLRVHTDEYLQSVQERDVLERIFGVKIADNHAENLLAQQRLMVGGTIQATRLALRGYETVVNLGGGFHHARRDRGAGFCIFNDLAVAIARLRARGFKHPVLVIDLDMHDGDGTRTIFANDPTVHTFSVHNANWGSNNAEGSTSVALGDDVEDETYLGTVLKALPSVFEAVDPGLVFYVAGTDPAADDVFGNWQVSGEGLFARDRFVVDLVRNHPRQPPLVILLGGGYGDSSWKYTARFLSWLISGRVIEPPENDQLTLMRFRRILNEIDPVRFTAEPSKDGFSWQLTAEDLEGIMPGVPLRTRFLRFFSHHGLELLLERVGIYDQLRLRGFTHPTLKLDLTHPLGQTLRIFADPSLDDLLAELRVNRSRHVVPDFEVLIVEWLLLQNPRAGFGPFRRPLPGQNHPGLGLLKQFLGWLVVVCEMLELDGLYFTPSSYHVAAQSRAIVRFLKPEHEARFRVLCDCLRSMPLADASVAVENGCVVDTNSGEALKWEGFPMVLPVSENLRNLVFGETYEDRVALELGRHAVRLADESAGHE